LIVKVFGDVLMIGFEGVGLSDIVWVVVLWVR